MDEPNFHVAFEPQASLVDEDYGPFILYQQDLGELLLPSGQLVACDALAQFPQKPFANELAPGSYRTTLSIAQYEGGDERVACAVLHANRGIPVSWEVALVSGQDPETLKEDDPAGFPVDSGTACLVSLEGHLTLQQLFKKANRILSVFQRKKKEPWEIIADEMDKSYKHTRSWANFVIDPGTGLNLVACSSGLGDGLYSSYWGFDAQHRVAALLVDFGLLPL